MIRSYWLMTLVSSFVSFQLFCLVFLSIIERGVLKSSTINVFFSILFPVLTVFTLCILQLCLVYTYLRLLILVDWSLYNVPPCSGNFLCLNFILSDVNAATSCFLQINICLFYLFSSFHFHLPVLLYLKWVSCR